MAEALDGMSEAARRRRLMVEWFREQRDEFCERSCRAAANKLDNIAEDIFQGSCDLIDYAENFAWTFDADRWYPPKGHREVIQRHTSGAAVDTHSVDHTQAILDELFSWRGSSPLLHESASSRKRFAPNGLARKSRWHPSP